MNMFMKVGARTRMLSHFLSRGGVRKSHLLASSGLEIQPLESRLHPQNILQKTCDHSLYSQRFVQTASESDPNLWQKFKTKVLNRNLSLPKQVLILSGYKMYICVTDQLDFSQFITETKLPDTFNSWFLLVQLHVWMCMVKLTTMGEEGKIIRNNLVHAMWKDLESRGKQLGKAAPSGTRRQSLQHFNDIFRASLFNFDEGLLGDDKVLAAAIWRTLFELEEKDPEILALMVYYVRKQIHHIEKQDTDLILSQGFISLLPLHGETESKDHRKKLLVKLFNQQIML